MNIHIYDRTKLFFILSTFFPWTLWFIAGYISHINVENSWISIIAFFGLVAPVVITLLLVSGNKGIISDIKYRFFNFKGVKLTYIILTLLLMPFSILMAQAVSLLFGYGIEQFSLAKSFSFSSGVFPVWVMLIIAPLLEELAWHSYGTDALRSRFNLIKTSLIFALFWGIWHFPLSFIKDYYHSNLAESGIIYAINFFVSLFPFVVIMNWLYYHTNRNILITIIFHISAGYFNEVFATHPMSKVIQTCFLLVFSVYIINNDRPFFFNQKIYTS